MGYWHMFYGVDIDRLRSIFGSGDESFVDEMLGKRAEELQELNDTFCDEVEEGRFPDAETALREIVDGSFDFDEAAAMYGYVFKELCEHVGRPIGDEVSSVDEHPYRSKLAESGPPVAIPDDPGDFPEIGYLELGDIPDEIARIDAVSKPDTGRVKSWFARLTGKETSSGGQDDETDDDMRNYRNTLAEALRKKVSVVSFRH